MRVAGAFARKALLVTLVLTATTQTKATLSSSEAGPLQPLHDMRRLVEQEGACAMPGVNIKYSNFLRVMWKSVASGHVRFEHASYVMQGLRDGFRVGFQPERMRGHREFRNYPTSLDHPVPTVGAIQERVKLGKTLDLGPWCPALSHAIRATYPASAVFPMGTQAKPLEPDKRRTGLEPHFDNHPSSDEEMALYDVRIATRKSKLRK